MSEKQQQLTFEKGITNVPSDALCSDNCLSDCVGMVYDNGEHRPIQQPKLFMTVGEGIKILFIHTPNSGTNNYIVKDEEGKLRWGNKNEGRLDLNGQVLLGSVSADAQVMSIGKTVIVNETSGLSYFTWKGTDYLQINSNIPDIDIDFRLVNLDAGEEGEASTFHIFTVNNMDPIPVFDPRSSYGNQKEYNNVVVGQYYERKKQVAKKKRFVGPFFVRAALMMYDGSYTKMTAPVLMVPTMSCNAKARWYYDREDDSLLHLSVFSCELQYKLNSNYEEYNDLISDVVIFVTKEVETIDADADAKIPGADTQDVISIYTEDGKTTRARHLANLDPHPHIEESTGTHGIEKETLYDYNVLVPRSEFDINSDIAESGQFYKIAEIGTRVDADWQDAAAKIRDHVMDNLTSQEQLTDEYFGHSTISGSYAYVYNARLNLANVKRTVFNGFDKMLAYDWYDNEQDASPHPYKYDIFVSVGTSDGNVLVKKQIDNCIERIGMWFYYPDSRANHVLIYKDGKLILDADLKEHLGLNGAYFFSGLPVSGEYEPIEYTSDLPTALDENIEELSNSIVTSEVNNPFKFNASGYYQAGDGTVLAVVSNTQALSQGQFGQFPLIVFTDRGMWAIDTDNTGLFVTSKPLTREVCKNKHSIAQTDNAIFFSSDKGLMVLVGAETKCVSEQLNGKNSNGLDFNTFLQDSMTAYDYRDSLLWFGHPNSEMFWIYSIKNGTFHRYSMSDEEIAARRAGGTTPIFNFVNYYPDYLLQIGSSVFSLVSRPNTNADPLSYDAFMETRPMKLENALALKSIMQIRHILQFHPYKKKNEETHETETKRGTMSLHIYASNNLDTEANSWVELHSLRGTPWKYYKFRYVFKDMKATDRFAGTMLITQERRTNKLR